MRFLFLIHGDSAAEAALTADERMEIVRAHMMYADLLRERGVHVLGEALNGEAATVRPGERPLVTDGPFAETKEAVGGFYVVDCASRDEAIELAGRVPPAPASPSRCSGSPRCDAYPADRNTASAMARYPASVGCGSPFEQMKVSAQSRA